MCRIGNDDDDDDDDDDEDDDDGSSKGSVVPSGNNVGSGSGSLPQQSIDLTELNKSYKNVENYLELDSSDLDNGNIVNITEKGKIDNLTTIFELIENTFDLFEFITIKNDKYYCKEHETLIDKIPNIEISKNKIKFKNPIKEINLDNIIKFLQNLKNKKSIYLYQIDFNNDEYSISNQTARKNCENIENISKLTSLESNAINKQKVRQILHISIKICKLFKEVSGGDGKIGGMELLDSNYNDRLKQYVPNKKINFNILKIENLDNLLELLKHLEKNYGYYLDLIETLLLINLKKENASHTPIDITEEDSCGTGVIDPFDENAFNRLELSCSRKWKTDSSDTNKFLCSSFGDDKIKETQFTINISKVASEDHTVIDYKFIKSTSTTYKYNKSFFYIRDREDTQKEDYLLNNKIKSISNSITSDEVNNKVIILFVFGITGSGKSYFLSQYQPMKTFKITIEKPSQKKTFYYFNKTNEKTLEGPEGFTKTTPFNPDSSRGFTIERYKVKGNSNKFVYIIDMPGLESLIDILQLSFDMKKKFNQKWYILKKDKSIKTIGKQTTRRGGNPGFSDDETGTTEASYLWNKSHGITKFSENKIHITSIEPYISQQGLSSIEKLYFTKKTGDKGKDIIYDDWVDLFTQTRNPIIDRETEWKDITLYEYIRYLFKYNDVEGNTINGKDMITLIFQSIFIVNRLTLILSIIDNTFGIYQELRKKTTTKEIYDKFKNLINKKSITIDLGEAKDWNTNLGNDFDTKNLFRAYQKKEDKVILYKLPDYIKTNNEILDGLEFLKIGSADTENYIKDFLSIIFLGIMYNDNKPKTAYEKERYNWNVTWLDRGKQETVSKDWTTKIDFLRMSSEEDKAKKRFKNILVGNIQLEALDIFKSISSMA